MLLRLALLAMLCAVSPMPFAMYASESTAHWTKTWVGMFLGVTFQQVVTLALILGLADKAPDLVNPAGRGLFSSAGTALKTGAAAAGGALSGGAVGARNDWGGISGLVSGYTGGGGGQGSGSGVSGGGDDGSGGGSDP